MKISRKPSLSLLFLLSISFNELCSLYSYPIILQRIPAFQPERECKCIAFFYPKQTFYCVSLKKIGLYCCINFPILNPQCLPQRTSLNFGVTSLSISFLKRGCKDIHFCFPAMLRISFLQKRQIFYLSDLNSVDYLFNNLPKSI